MSTRMAHYSWLLEPCSDSYDETCSGRQLYPFRLYVNGQTDGSSGVVAPETPAGPFMIGARGVSAATVANLFFDGQVDKSRL